MGGPHDLEGLFDVFIQSCFDFKSCPEESLSVRDRINEFITHGHVVTKGNHKDWVILDQKNGETMERNGVGSEVKNDLPHKVLVLGSGGLSIGQAGEFDYSGSQVYITSLLHHHYIIIINNMLCCCCTGNQSIT